MEMMNDENDLAKSTGYRCGTCCARTGEQHAADCAEANIARAAIIAADMLAELDPAKVPLAVPASIGVLRTAVNAGPAASRRAAGQAGHVAMTEQQVADAIKEKQLVTDLGHRALINGDTINASLSLLTRFANSLCIPTESAAAPAELPDDWQAAIAEVERATLKFPTWPTDPLHAVTVLGEEFGELTKAVLQTTYEPHKVQPGELRTEAIQTAAMSLRFLASLGRYEFSRSAQHEQGATHQLSAQKGGA